MAEYSSNLLINPYADEPVTTGWTASNNAEVISGGYLGAAFRLSSPAYLEQVIPVDTFGEDTKGIQLSCRARFTNSGPALYAEIVLYLRLQITNADGTTAFFMPCQTIIMPGVSTWILFEKGFEERISGITEVVFRVYATNENVIVDLDNISVAIDETRTESEQAFDDAVDYTNLGIEAHLNDITNSHLSDEQKYGLTGGAQRVRSIKLGMETNVRIANHNLYGQLPIVKLEAIREQTPIITPLFWTELLVKTVANVTSTSVAVQYDENGIGKVFVAYVADSTLYIRAAQFSYPISEMIWEDVEEIPGCSQCALDFDGRFVGRLDGTVVFYTEELPYLVYTNSSNSMWYKKPGEVQQPLVGANVLSLDVIRGISGNHDSIDNGLHVFYIIGGSLYYNSLIDGNWEGQQSVPIAPANLVSVKAERTKDYRIVLHVTDADGKLYEIFTRMEASGWNGIEQQIMSMSISSELLGIIYTSLYSTEQSIVSLSATSALLYGLPPVIMDVRNISIEGEYGTTIEVDWDERIFREDINYKKFHLTDEAYGYFGCLSLIKTGNRLTLTCHNFNNATGQLTLHYTPGNIIGEVELVEAQSFTFTPIGLVPFPVAPPEPVSIWNTDDKTIMIQFDKSIYRILDIDGFIVSAEEPTMSPDGPLVVVNYPVVDVEMDDGVWLDEEIDLSTGVFNNTEVVV